MNNAENAKFNMIEQQIRPWEVLDHQVLSTLEHLNREDFVRDVYKGLAYADCQIPLGSGVHMLPPTIEGRMLQALTIKADDDILEIGSAGGYITACLARLGSQVTSIDSSPEIIEFAQLNITTAGFENIEFRQMGLAQIEVTDAYDVIAVNGSMANIPKSLKKALKIGGRLFAIVGDSPVMQALLVTRVSESEFTTQSLFETDLPRIQS